MLSTLIFLAAATFAPESSSRPMEVSARRWFNVRTVQIPDRRTHVLFFFSTVQNHAETVRHIERLNRLHKKADLEVLGLCAESSRRVEEFIKKRGVRFPVGAVSKAYKQFKIQRFPAVVVFDPETQQRSEELKPVPLDDLAGYDGWEDDGAQPVSGDFDETTSVTQLQAHARFDSDSLQRRRAVHLLRSRMATEEFLSLCDELLETSEDPTLRGSIAYQRHLADPSTPEKEPVSPPSALANRARQENPEAPEWQPVREYEEFAGELSPSELASDFFDYQQLGLDPTSLLIRREIASRFNAISENGSEEEKAEARTELMGMLPGEPDAAVRLWLVGALWSTTKPGDLEVADFLTEQLAIEPNIRSVRPMMETVIRCLRTGEGPCE